MNNIKLPQVGVSQTPINIGGCFGWMHLTKAGGIKDTALLLCPGLKRDDLTGYGTFRLLADKLSEQGYPTLRLHYPSTGNSYYAGEVEYLKTWQNSIIDAADWLRANYSANHIILCGARFGAMLAASVATTVDATGLVLLAPVIRGRSYIRQLMVEAKQLAEGSIDAGEFQLSIKTTDLIRQMDMRKINLPTTCQVAVFSEPSALIHECENAWKKFGINVAINDFSGLGPILRPTWLNHEETAQVDRIVSWINTLPNNMALPQNVQLLDKVEIKTGDVIETPLFFGNSNNLFGILSRPRNCKNNTVVLSGNAGGDPHVAIAAVRTARHLASQGISAFRFDFSGIGDSTADVPTHVFDQDRSEDFRAAVNALS